MIRFILNWIDNILNPKLYYKPYRPNILGEHRKNSRKRKISNSYKLNKSNLLYVTLTFEGGRPQSQ